MKLAHLKNPYPPTRRSPLIMLKCQQLGPAVRMDPSCCALLAYGRRPQFDLGRTSCLDNLIEHPALMSFQKLFHFWRMNVAELPILLRYGLNHLGNHVFWVEPALGRTD
jgi:hypothetical protein